MEMFLVSFPMMYIFCSLFALREYVLMLMTSSTETYFDCYAKLHVLNKVMNIIKFVKHFLKSTTDTQS